MHFYEQWVASVVVLPEVDSFMLQSHLPVCSVRQGRVEKREDQDFPEGDDDAINSAILLHRFQKNQYCGM